MDLDREKIASAEHPEQIFEYVNEQLHKQYEERKALTGDERWTMHERMLMLHVIDTQWKDHLYALDHLKEGIGFRGYGQRDPLVEYKKESFELFEEMMNRMEEDIVRYVFLTKPPTEEQPAPRAVRQAPRAVRFSGPSMEGSVQPARKGEKVGRNDPCPCGSGKKYKKCCGVNA